MTAAGPAALQRRLATLPRAAETEVAAALGAVGDMVLAEARRILATSGAGPSAPGEPPADPTGTLAASLGASLDRAAARITLTAASPHAIALEYGTRTMGARPFLRPAVQATADEARRTLEAALARAAGADGGPS